MWLVGLAVPCMAGPERNVDRWFRESTHVFTAVVEAVVADPSGTFPGTRYGLRVGEQLQGRIESGYVVLRTGDGPSADGSVYWMHSTEFELGYREEVLLFASLGPTGALDVRTSDLRMVSRLPGEGGAMYAHLVGTDGWNRQPLGEGCATTGDLVDVSVDLDARAVQTSRCGWTDLLQRLRAAPTPGARAVAAGDAPLPAGATAIGGGPAPSLFDVLAQPRP